MCGEAGADGGFHEGGGQVGTDTVLVGPASGPEQAGVALARVGGEDELDQSLALMAGCGKRAVARTGWRREQAQKFTRAGRGREVGGARRRAVHAVFGA